MIQSKKTPHSLRDVLAFSENYKKHFLVIKTAGNGKFSQFTAKLNKKELAEICIYLEQNFQIHKEDI